MTFKLINDKGLIHDFRRMGWGHNIEEMSNTQEPVYFEDIQTYKCHWFVFNPMPISKGDFIIRNMRSGKVGVFECLDIIKDRGDSPFGPDDLYNGTFAFCGYWENGTILIHDGYGIKKKINLLNKWVFRALLALFIFITIFFAIPILITP